MGGTHSHDGQPLRLSSMGWKSQGQRRSHTAGAGAQGLQVPLLHKAPSSQSLSALHALRHMHTLQPRSSFCWMLTVPGGQGGHTTVPAFGHAAQPMASQSPMGHASSAGQAGGSMRGPHSPSTEASQRECSSTRVVGEHALTSRKSAYSPGLAPSNLPLTVMVKWAPSAFKQLTVHVTVSRSGELAALYRWDPGTDCSGLRARRGRRGSAVLMAEHLANLAAVQERGTARLVHFPEDRELAERFARGDAWAREALYRKYVQSVWGLALRLTGNRTDAEDVVQDTFAEALRDAAQLRDRAAIRSWLLGVAVHQVHRRFRRRRLLRALGLDRGATHTLDELASRNTPPDVLVELKRVSSQLERLPARSRITWTLRFVEGCSLVEIAEYCGCSLATVKRQIASAQRRLAQYVEIAEPADE